MKKKYNYYKIDTGFLPQIMKVAFSNKNFQALLEDHDLDVGVEAFKAGEAETHFITSSKLALIVLVFDLAKYADDDDDAVLVGVIAHEVSHAVDRLSEFIGGTPITDEPRAYLTESLVGQIYTAVAQERKILARKANRKLPSFRDQTVEWLMPKVDLDNNGGAGSDSDTAGTPKVCRAKDKVGRNKPKTKDSI